MAGTVPGGVGVRRWRAAWARGCVYVAEDCGVRGGGAASFVIGAIGERPLGEIAWLAANRAQPYAPPECRAESSVTCVCCPYSTQNHIYYPE